jgi:hypothetical protein
MAYEQLAEWDLTRLAFEYRSCGHFIGDPQQQEKSDAIAEEIKKREMLIRGVIWAIETFAHDQRFAMNMQVEQLRNLKKVLGESHA